MAPPQQRARKGSGDDDGELEVPLPSEWSRHDTERGASSDHDDVLAKIDSVLQNEADR